MRWLPYLFAILTLMVFACPASGADPDYYQRKSTWHETLIASRQALLAEQGPEKFQTFVSEVVRGRESARPIKVNIAGLKDIYLYVIGERDEVRGLGDWAEATLVQPRWPDDSPWRDQNAEGVGRPAQRQQHARIGRERADSHRRPEVRPRAGGLRQQQGEDRAWPGIRDVRGNDRHRPVGWPGRFGSVHRNRPARRSSDRSVGVGCARFCGRCTAARDEMGAAGPHPGARLAQRS